MQVIPVRRDGTGRLVAVGLVEVAGSDGRPRWTLIGGPDLPDESTDQAVERCVRAALGDQANGRPAALQPAWITDPGPGVDGLRVRDHSPRSGGEEACAAEISGHLQPQSPVQRFSWFLVTALPAQPEFEPDARAALADFLDAQGELGLATRLR